MTAANGRANSSAFNDPRELVVPTLAPPAVVSPSSGS